jgi:hypothetical protein
MALDTLADYIAAGITGPQSGNLTVDGGDPPATPKPTPEPGTAGGAIPGLAMAANNGAQHDPTRRGSAG